MGGDERMRAELGAAVAGAGSALVAADRLCHACVALLEVDGASLSLTHEGSTRGTFGSSGQVSQWLDELQFTFGEGPCLDAVRSGGPVLVADLDDPAEQRWPAFRNAVLSPGINAVFALPVAVASQHVGALDLYNRRSGPLVPSALAGELLAAELATLPLLDLLGADVDGRRTEEDEDSWDRLGSLQRVEVYQASGMLMAALDVDETAALVMLRARAFALGMTASEVAWAIVERRLSLEHRGWLGRGGAPGRVT